MASLPGRGGVNDESVVSTVFVVRMQQYLASKTVALLP
jgi:hypothetical protein